MYIHAQCIRIPGITGEPCDELRWGVVAEASPLGWRGRHDTCGIGSTDALTAVDREGAK
jgi:hypothetical protein